MKLHHKVFLVGNVFVDVERLVAALAGCGLQVIRASQDATGAFDWDRVHANVIVVKDRPPEVDGFQLCSQIRQRSHIPILLWSDEPASEAYSRAIEAGADCYMGGTVSRLELAARLKALVRRHEGNKGRAEDPSYRLASQHGQEEER